MEPEVILQRHTDLLVADTVCDLLEDHPTLQRVLVFVNASELVGE
jgi:hypothetical protein